MLFDAFQLVVITIFDVQIVPSLANGNCFEIGYVILLWPP